MAALIAGAACSTAPSSDDAGTHDAGLVDAGGGTTDSGAAPEDAGQHDAGSADAGRLDAVGRAMDARLAASFAAGAVANAARCPNAVAVAATPHGSLIRGYGAALDTSPQPPDEATLYQLGSLTKALTGLALARQVVEHRRDAGQPAAQLLGADLASALTLAQPTLLSLVTHTAGFPPMPTNLADGGAGSLAPAGGYSRQQLRDFLLAWTPGPAGYAYSNVGLGLLGAALTDAADAGGYHSLLRAEVLAPLGMTDSWGELAAIPTAARSRFAQGHAARGGRWTTGALADMGVLAGAGEVSSSGADIAKLLRALAGLSPSPLGPAIELAVTPAAPIQAGQQVGYAITLLERDGGVVAAKSGATQSYSAFFAVHRASGTGAALLVGCGEPFPAAELTLALLDDVRAAVAQ